jgi:hypothetical protein
MRAMDTPNLDKYWRCSLCPAKITLMKITKASNSNTTVAIRHLRAVHKVRHEEASGQENEDQEEGQEEEEEGGREGSSPGPSIVEILRSAPAKAAERFRALITRIDADNFRWFLLKWLVTMHIALVIIESDFFREFVHVIALTLDTFMVTSFNTIRN